MMAIFRAKPAAVAGEPLAELMLDEDRSSIDGALRVLDKRSDEPDTVMCDEAEGRRLWERLEELTQPAPR